MKKILIICSVLFLLFVGCLILSFLLFRNNQEVAIAETQKMEILRNQENNRFTAIKEVVTNTKEMVAAVIYLLGAVLVGLMIYKQKNKG